MCVRRGVLQLKFTHPAHAFTRAPVQDSATLHNHMYSSPSFVPFVFANTSNGKDCPRETCRNPVLTKYVHQKSWYVWSTFGHGLLGGRVGQVDERRLPFRTPFPSPVKPWPANPNKVSAPLATILESQLHPSSLKHQTSMLGSPSRHKADLTMLLHA